MISLITHVEAQRALKEGLKSRRLQQGLTQQGLALRADVSLFTLRKFEQQGAISLESFLKLLAVVGGLEEITQALQKTEAPSKTLDDVLKQKKTQKQRQRGWRT